MYMPERSAMVEKYQGQAALLSGLIYFYVARPGSELESLDIEILRGPFSVLSLFICCCTYT